MKRKLEKIEVCIVRTIKKSLSLLLCICMVFAVMPMIPLTSFAADTAISTFAQLKSAFLNGQSSVSGSYYLTNDIDCTGQTWTPCNYFNGTFDGKGYTIKNLTYNGGGVSGEWGYMGLFRRTNGATVKNLRLDNINFTITGGSNEYFAGALFGRVNGGTVTITNCSVINSSIKTYGAGGSGTASQAGGLFLAKSDDAGTESVAFGRRVTRM